MNNIEIKLTKEQEEVVNSESNFLIVLAGPGTGKTETLSRYIIKNSINTPSHKINLVSSFTKNGATEIKNRVKKRDSNINNNIYMTFDSFLIHKIWRYFLNRIIKFVIEKYELNIVETSYKIIRINYPPQDYKQIDKEWKDKYQKTQHIQEWINNMKTNIFNASYISDAILFEFLSESDDLQKYFKNNFNKIIIDEAQDLNLIRYSFIYFFYIQLDIAIVLIGDEKQTLFEFLGADKTIFEKIKNYFNNNKIKYSKLILTKNFRYQGNNNNVKEILNTKNSQTLQIVLKNANDLETTNNLYEYISKIDDPNKTIFVICATNNEVIHILDQFKKQKFKDVGAYLKIDNKILTRFNLIEQEFIESLYTYKILKNKYNSNVKNRISISPVSNIKNFLYPFDYQANKKFLKLFSIPLSTNFDSILEIIKNTWKLDISPIWDFYNNDVNYLKNLSPQKIQIMTIHSSKGLEADYIFIKKNFIENFWKNKFNAPKFENVFVALSRVKKDIILFTDPEDKDVYSVNDVVNKY